jgi:GAF domain-containing protein
MYDPLVVDTFIAVHPTIAPAAILAGQNARSLLPTLMDGTAEAAPLRDIRATAIQSSQLAEYSRELAAIKGISEAISLTDQYVRLFMPCDVSAVFKHDTQADLLVCAGAAGDDDGQIKLLSIRRGDRISGWAAANDATIANSDASLDLGTIVDRFVPPLRSALSTPIKEGERLLGVLTIYTHQTQPYGDDHKYLAERVAAMLASRLDSFEDQPVRRFRTEALVTRRTVSVDR